MADFCNQCAKVLGFPTGDMKGLSSKRDTEAGLFAVVICESCGLTHVDHEGNCVDPHCLEKHGAAPAPDPAPKTAPCGGCGATSDNDRCVGCMHDFGTPESAWVRDKILARNKEDQKNGR